MIVHVFCGLHHGNLSDFLWDTTQSKTNGSSEMYSIRTPLVIMLKMIALWKIGHVIVAGH